MNFRKTIASKAIIASTAALMASAPMAAHAATALTVSNPYVAGHYFSTHGFDAWMSCVTEKSAGSVTFNYFPSGQLASAAQSLDALNDGLVDVSVAPIGYLSSKMPLNGVTMLPGFGTTAQEILAAYRGVLNQDNVLSQEFNANKIKPIFVNVLPAFQIFSTKEPIQSADGLKGLLVRSAGASNSVTLKALGSSPVEMPASEAYIAMERGTVNAMLGSISSLKPYSLNELVKSISRNGQFGTFPTFGAMSDAAWAKLTPQEQGVVTDCGRSAEQKMAVVMDDENAALQAEFAAAGVAVYDFPEDVMAKMSTDLATVHKEYIDRLEARKIPAAQAYDTYKAAIAK